MNELPKKPNKLAEELDGYFKVFLGTTSFHLLMKDLISRQVAPFDLAFVFSRTESKGDWTTLRLDSRFRNSFLKKKGLLKYIQQSLRKLMIEHRAENEPVALFYPNDDAFEYQFAISYFKTNAKTLKLVMYEDGLGSLRTREEHREKRPWKLFKKNLYRLLLSGDYYNIAGFRGSLADMYVGLSKEAFSDECSSYSRPLTVLDMKMASGHPKGTTAASLGRKTHIFLSEVLVEDHVIPEGAWLEYIGAAGVAMGGVTDELYVKPHPRENAEKFQKTVDVLKKHIKRVEVMGQRVSIEEYVNGVKDRQNLVLHGCRTGGLYYVKLLYPEISVVMHHEHLVGKNSELDSNIRFHRKLMESAGCKA